VNASLTTLQGAVAEIAGVDPATVGPSSRLVEDVGLDSFGLLELMLACETDLGMNKLGEDLEQRNWSGVTVQQLYEQYTPR